MKIRAGCLLRIGVKNGGARYCEGGGNENEPFIIQIELNH